MDASSGSQCSWTQPRWARGATVGGPPSGSGTKRSSNPTARTASSAPLASCRAANERRRKSVLVSLDTCRSTLKPAAKLMAPRFSGAPSTGSATKVLDEIAPSASTSPASAASAAWPANTVFRPLCCSSRPAKKLPATSAAMITRAKMATASAIPRWSFNRRRRSW